MNKKTRKILLVEDDMLLSKVYKIGLEDAGFEIDTAGDGAAGFRKVKSAKPDLILLDLVMPYKDGFEVLEDLKKDKKLSTIPVIILSNLGQESEIKKGYELGAIDYFVKSDSTMEFMVRKLKKYLK